MKFEELARPGLLAVGALGFAATALLGFAAGVALARDPEGLRRTARRVAGEAARGFERASLLAAQAREQIGDLWAEVREEAVSEVDTADFKRAAARASKATPAAAAAAAAAAAGTATDDAAAAGTSSGAAAGSSADSAAREKPAGRRRSRSRKPSASRAAAKNTSG